MNYKKHIISLFFVVACFFINAQVAFADFNPGTPCDPDDLSCPIDSWCIALAFIALIATTAYLYRKQKVITTLDYN